VVVDDVEANGPIVRCRSLARVQDRGGESSSPLGSVEYHVGAHPCLLRDPWTRIYRSRSGHGSRRTRRIDRSTVLARHRRGDGYLTPPGRPGGTDHRHAPEHVGAGRVHDGSIRLRRRIVRYRHVLRRFHVPTRHFTGHKGGPPGAETARTTHRHHVEQGIDGGRDEENHVDRPKCGRWR